MLDERYYEGFEGEEQVTIWCDEDGMVIWSGYFETILEGCWRSDFSHDGIVKCYHNRDGFFDGVWEITLSIAKSIIMFWKLENMILII